MEPSERILDMEPDVTESDLLRHLRARDETALLVLLAHFERRLAAVARGAWAGISDSDTEEILADVLADAWFRWADIDERRGGIGAWLVMRTRFRTLDRIREANRRTRTLDRLRRLRHAPEATMPTYESELDAYLAGLTETEREIVRLRFLDGQPVLEVAQRCGMTPKAAEHRIARLRTELRRRSGILEELEAPSHA